MTWAICVVYPLSVGNAKPGPDDCYHCHGNGYNIINNKKWTCQFCEGTGKKLIQVEVKWLHCNNCGADYDYQ